MIRSPRPQGPAALLAALGLATDELADMPNDADASESFEQSMLDWLVLDVGDRLQMDQLDEQPLPDEPFQWDGIPDDVTARVHEVLAAHRPLLRGDTRRRVPHRMPTGTCPRRI